MTENGAERLTCTPENTELYIHHPDKWKDVDHLFYRLDPESDRRLGGFVWRHILGDEEFEALGTRMSQSLNWMIVYRPEPTETDMNEYLKEAVDVPDSLPDDFQWEL